MQAAAASGHGGAITHSSSQVSGRRRALLGSCWSSSPDCTKAAGDRRLKRMARSPKAQAPLRDDSGGSAALIVSAAGSRGPRRPEAMACDGLYPHYRSDARDCLHPAIVCIVVTLAIVCIHHCAHIDSAPPRPFGRNRHRESPPSEPSSMTLTRPPSTNTLASRASDPL